MQAEYLKRLRRTSKTKTGYFVHLELELQLYNATDLKDVLQNQERRYTVAVYYHTRRVYYITIPPIVVHSMCRHI